MTLAGKTWETAISVDRGFGEARLADLLPPDTAMDPARLRLELLAPSVEREAAYSSGISQDVWVWLGFERISGLQLQASKAPSNLVIAQSQNIVVDASGQISLDRIGGFEFARVTFATGELLGSFNFPWPDITLTRRRADGSVSTISVGTRISVGAEDHFDHISIRCPDREANLLVGGRKEIAPFLLGMTRNLAIRDVLNAGGGKQVVLHRGSGAEAVLFELVDALQPQAYSTRPTAGIVCFKVSLGRGIAAFGLEIEDELSHREMVEVSVGRHPAETRAPEWLQVRLPNGDASEIEVTILHNETEHGLRVGRIFIKPDPLPGQDFGWRPLKNNRGDTYAVPLNSAVDLETAPRDKISPRFDRLCLWMSDCYAPECWPDLARTVEARWRSLGQDLFAQPLGAGAMMRAALLPPPDTVSPSWIPLRHPIEIVPSLYSVEEHHFAALATLDDVALSAMPAVAAVSKVRLRELLHSAALMAFENRHAAGMRDDITLAGFSVVRFFAVLPVLDTDPSAGWFWRGTPILGPDHWRAGHIRYLERVDAAGIFSDDDPETGGNSLRREALRTLLDFVWQRTEPNLRPPAPKRATEDERPASADVRVACTLSEFAKASRFGSTSDFIAACCTGLGWRKDQVLSSLGLLLRLAPELFAFYLLVWQISKERK